MIQIRGGCEGPGHENHDLLLQLLRAWWGCVWEQWVWAVPPFQGIWKAQFFLTLMVRRSCPGELCWGSLRGSVTNRGTCWSFQVEAVVSARTGVWVCEGEQWAWLKVLSLG
jgi:hypothetical protein